MASHDPAYRRRAQRAGRQRGCLVYVPAEELRRAGIDPAGPPPHYRVWAAPGRPRVIINFYKEQ